MRSLAGSQVVVTGGAGFLGSWLCERLLREGAGVWCVDSLVTGRLSNVSHLVEHPRFHLERADVTVGFSAPPHVGHVLHLASPASPRHYLQLPLETLRAGSQGTERALELALAHGARFVLASTSEVYGDPLVHPQPETYWGNVNPLGVRSVYDEAKRYAEALTMAYRRAHGVDTGIARIFNTYGPRMDPHDGRVVPTFLRQVMAGEPLTVAGDGSQTRCLCYVEDTVDGLVRLAVSDVADPVNLGSDDEITVVDLARLVIKIAGSGSSLDFVPLPEDDPRVRRPELGRARERLGWTARVPLEDGLAATLRWLEEGGSA